LKKLANGYDNVISFKKARKQGEDDRLAAADKYLRQQAWFQNEEAKYKKRDFVIIIFIIDVIMGVVAYLI